MSQQQQQLLKQDMTVSQVLRTYGRQFRQIQNLYSDGVNGRCALGVIMSYYGWDGRDDSDAAELLLAASIQMKHAVVDEGLLIDLNDSGYTFDEIADYLDSINEIAESLVAVAIIVGSTISETMVVIP